MSETKSLCEDCTESRWCETYGEVKCLAQKKRIYGYVKLIDPAQCKFYKKRGKNFKESKCQCEDCLRNEQLVEEAEEE